MQPVGTRTRLAEAADAEAIFGFDHVARSTPSRHASVLMWIGGGCCRVIEAGGEVVAYGVIQHSFYGNGFIPQVYVAPQWRRGIGSGLVAHMEGVCATPKLFTSTNESNLPMRQLLVRLGYTPSGVIDNLDDADPELVFFKKLR